MVIDRLKSCFRPPHAWLCLPRSCYRRSRLLFSSPISGYLPDRPQTHRSIRNTCHGLHGTFGGGNPSTGSIERMIIPLKSYRSPWMRTWRPIHGRRSMRVSRTQPEMGSGSRFSINPNAPGQITPVASIFWSYAAKPASPEARRGRPRDGVSISIHDRGGR